MIKFIGHTVAVVSVIAAGIAADFLWARVLQDLWRWFVISWIHAPPLPFFNALGLMLVGTVFTWKLANNKIDHDKDTGPYMRGLTVVGSNAIGALIIWGFGALWASFL